MSKRISKKERIRRLEERVGVLEEALGLKKDRSKLIKEGLAKSGYKPSGKKANLENHKRILYLDDRYGMTKEDIAKEVGVGVATVYRVLREKKTGQV